MSNISTIVAILVSFLFGSLVISEWIWRRIKSERDDRRERDRDDLGGAT